MTFLLERFKKFADTIAFVHNERELTYSQVLSKIDEYSSLIEKNGVRSGQVVCLLGDYSPEIFSFLLALMKNGNVVCPLTYDSVVEKDKVFEIAEVQWFVKFSNDQSSIEFVSFERKVTNALLKKLVEKNEAGLVLFSSGSTGTPKGMLHQFSTVLNRYSVERKPTAAIVFLMFDHFGGLNTLFGLTSSGGKVITVHDRSVKTVCSSIERHKVELLPTTPSFLNMIVHTGAYKSFDLTSLKKITYGTEVMPQATLDRLNTLFPTVTLQQTYGLSELGVLSSKSRPDGSLWVKIGGEGFNLKIKEGTLWIKSEFAMLGYLNAPDPFDEEGWFNTQDQVEVEGEYFRILGRTTDLINVGGQKVYPTEIENVVLALPNIEDAVVYSETNPLLGQMIVVEVKILNEEPLLELKKRIRSECLKKLASYKVPSKVVIAKGDLYSQRMKKKRFAVGKSESPQA